MTDHLITVSDGTTLSCHLHGDISVKPVLIFSNSLGTTRRMWDAQIAAFSKTHAVLTYDTRGHGASQAPAGSYSVDRLALDVLDMMDALGIVAASFCGVSLGGMTGQILAARAPERFENMIFSTTSAYMGPPSGWQGRIDLLAREGMSAIADGSMGKWFTAKALSENRAEMLAMKDELLGLNVQGYSGCCAAIRDMDMRSIATLNKIRTLVIVGLQDEATPPAHGLFLNEAAGNGEYLELDAAHIPNVELPDAFNFGVAEFLAGDA